MNVVHKERNGGIIMKELQTFMAENNNYIDYDDIKSNEVLKNLIYSHIDIKHEQTPFDYIDSLWLNDDNSFGASIFVEPVGNISFTGEPIENFFKSLNTFFNSQPTIMNYALSGHKIYHYAKMVRKGRGIDFRFLDTAQVWSIDINEEQEENEILLSDIQSGKDLFQYINQKNRLPIAILDGICFMNDGLEDLMMGEIIYADTYMPDLFKVVIDMSKFEEHNQYILEKAGYSEKYKCLYPKNRIVEYYFAYDDVIREMDTMQFLKEEEIPFIKEEAKRYWESGFDGAYLEFREHTKANQK